MQIEPQHRHALPKGFRLNEYEIERVLGKPGGFGITYLATDTYLQKKVAIKEYLPGDFAIREGVSTVQLRSTSDVSDFRWGMDCFIAEARALAKFEHRNIVRVLRYFEANNTAYMVMEYQEGENLTDFMSHRQNRSFSEAELLTLTMPLLDGLMKIHAEGLLHRDIKPSNIYIRDDGSPVLLDFGSARYAIGQKSRTVTSIVSPGYAPLEQYDNSINDQGAWTDIYALGAVIYFLISGEPPPAATRRVMKDPLIPAVTLASGRYSKAILKAVDWALQLNERDRPQTVEIWRAAFLSASDPKTTSNTVSVRLAKQSMFANWVFPAVGGLAIIFLIAVISALIHLNEQLNQQQEARQTAEQQLSQTLVQLEKEKQKRKEAEEKRLTAETMVNQILRFSDQSAALEKSRFEDITNNAVESKLFNKYYDVIEVKANDVLNIRPFPAYFGEVIGKIPPDAKCILYLNKLHFARSQGGNLAPLWVMVEYQGVNGWVHSRYLQENQNCKTEENAALNASTKDNPLKTEPTLLLTTPPNVEKKE